jgi:hypothetical protein
MSTATRHEDNLARAEARYEAAQDAVFDASDVLADYLEDGGSLILELVAGQTRMCPQFIALRDAVDEVQAVAHQLSIHNAIASYYVGED